MDQQHGSVWLAAVALCWATATIATPAWADPPATETTWLANARSAYQKRATTEQAQQAVAFFRKSIETRASYEALCEGARAAFFLAEYPLADGREKRRAVVFEQGVQWARQAVALRNDGATGHFWLASLLGALGKSRGILKALFMRDEIRTHGHRSMALDGDVECAGPFRLLGRFYFKVPRMMGGNRQRGLELLTEGVRRCPDNNLGRYFLADTLQDFGRRDEARQQLERVLNTPPVPRYAPEYPYVTRLVRKLLADL
jgi:tetratricopeptide (TPR) repeat protein